MTRLDVLLVKRGLVVSRARAKAAIAAGGVTVDGRPARGASETVPEDAVLTVEELHPYVGRGALKLAHALDLWPVSVHGRTVLDIGASTGGFTEVCLLRGAAQVVAVDVGQGQLHARIAGDPRVINLERTDVRTLTQQQLPTSPDLIVCDVSFISLIKALNRVLDLAHEGTDLIALIKPQFEADGPKGVGRGGIVKDPQARQDAVTRVSDWLSASGWTVHGLTESPITGGDGNVEYLLWARRAPIGQR